MQVLRNLLNFLIGTEITHELLNVYDRYVKYVKDFEKSLYFFTRSICKHFDVKNVEVKCSYSLIYKFNHLVKYVTAHGVDYTFITVTPLVSYEEIVKTILLFKFVRRLGYKTLEEYISILSTAVEVWENVEEIRKTYPNLSKFVEEQLEKSKLVQIVDKIYKQHLDFVKTMYKKYCKDAQLKLINFIDITLLPTLEKYVTKHLGTLNEMYRLCSLMRYVDAYELLIKNWIELLTTMKFLDLDTFIEIIDDDFKKKRYTDVMTILSFLLTVVEDKLKFIKEVVTSRINELRKKLEK